jgi:TolB-like protein
MRARNGFEALSMSLVEELKRRNVIRVGVLYVVVAWLLMQVADVGMSALELPPWTGKLVLFLLALGFPVVVIFSWVYELTPEGIKRESEVDRTRSVTHETGRKLNVTIAVLLVLAIGTVVVDRLVPEAPAPAEQAAEALPSAEPETVAEAPEPAAPVPAQPAEASIAVLPFVDMSPNKDNEYFSDGLTEELLNALAKIRALKVAGRTSSFAYKGKDQDLRVIGEELGVAHLLEGSVRMAGNRLRITAQLINASDGYHLWSETYDRELTDVFAIQTDIAEHVADALQVTLLGEDVARMQAGGTNDIEAYNDFLRGIYLLNQGSREEAVIEGVAALESAVARDPAYAHAWTALGTAMSVVIANAWGPLDQSWTRLGEAAREARRHAPELGGGYMLEAFILAYRDFRWPEGVTAMRRAAVLEPGNANIALNLAQMVRCVTLSEEVIAAGRRSVELEPANLLNQVFLGANYVNRRRCNEAEAVLRQVLATDPTYPRARYYIGVCRYLEGNYEGALQLFDAEPLPWMRHTGRPLALHKLGRTEEAQAAWTTLVETHRGTAAYQRAQVAAQWGDLDLAFESLEIGFTAGDVGVTQLLTDPLMEPLHGDPRYLEAVERAGLLPFYDDVMTQRAGGRAP